MKCLKYRCVKTLVVTVAMIVAPTIVGAQGRLAPPGIETFDGKTYAGIVLGETGDPELKALHRVFKSKLYPEALSIEVAEGQPIVDVLLDRRGGIATVQGIYLQYAGTGPNVKLLAARLKEEPTLWFHPRRKEAWHVAVFMKRGVVAFIDETDAGPATRTVLLCLPDSVTNGLSELLPEPTSVGDIPDPGQGWNRTGKVSGVLMTTTSSPSVQSGFFDGMQRDVRETAIEIGTGPRVIFVRGSPNAYRVSLQIDHDQGRDEYKISSRVSLRVDTPYGDIEESYYYTEYTNVLTKTRVLGVIRAGIVSVNRGLGGQLSRLRKKVFSTERTASIERFLKLATVSPP